MQNIHYDLVVINILLMGWSRQRSVKFNFNKFAKNKFKE
jgi:hypothetical protein